MKIERQKVGTVDVLAPTGALVDEDAERFSKLLQEHVGSANPRALVAMENVPYMDSVALEGLLFATEELADRGTSLKLAGVTPTCREILELTGLSGRFTFFNDVHDAVKSFL